MYGTDRIIFACRLTQSHIAKNYAAALIDKSKTAELKAYIGKYLMIRVIR